MFPNAFEYYAPETLDEVYGLLEQYGDEAKILAGGQSLLPMMKLRLAAPSVLIDIGHLANLSSTTETAEGLTVGALMRHKAIETGHWQRYPLLGETAPWIADPLVRNRGTIGGALAHADPAADWGAALLALNASVEIESRIGTRRMTLEEFFIDLYTTALEPQEILTRVVIPAPKTGETFARYLKLERKVGDFAVVGVAIAVDLTSDGTIANAGIGMAAMSGVPLAAHQTTSILVGQHLTPALIKEASESACLEGDPQSDRRGSAEYKHSMARIFVERGLTQILQQWRSTQSA
ncbi:MAG: carbon monoxide dehydrogenase [Sulfobacillus benefaciens]|uniref:Carbon monoxide dehydrogenase n=1 Tax=Sulfobacillus benefaciens TaxID=453960 RepID=A0A2T2XE50_9FIRM|nr:MAG: carbon monoxide dehydrogenase [Sulfobacillus benefaciens]